MNELLDLAVAYRSPLTFVAAIVVMLLLLVALNTVVGFIFKRLDQRATVPKLKLRLITVRRNVRILLMLLWTPAFIGVLGYSGYLLYQKIDLFEQGRSWLQNLPEGFWRVLGINLAKLAGLLIVAGVVSRLLKRGLLNLMARAKAFEQIKANDASIELFFNALVSIQKTTITLLVIMAAAAMFGAPDALQSNLALALTLYLIFAVGMLIVRAIAALVDSLDGLSRRYSRPDNFLRYYDNLRSLVPLLRRTIEYIIYVTMATLMVTQLSGIASLAIYGPRLVQVIGIFFLSRAVIEVFNLIIDKRMGSVEGMEEQEAKQRLTFVPLVKSIVGYLVYALAFVLILKALQIDPTPILASAGILGLVVGLGAQPLINDFISGFFILFENLFMVGDFIETGSTRGVVENIDIRTTRIRGGDGELHIIRNGSIGEVINYSKDYVFAVVLVGVAYESDLNQVYRVLRDTAEALQEQNPDILNPTELIGLDQFGESELTVRLVCRVKPGRHLSVSRQLRTLIKEAFDREGIEIPYARRVMIFQNADESAPAGLPAT